MKRNINDPQKLAIDIVDMNCRNLIIYCHSLDYEYVKEMIAESLHIAEALTVVNCKINVSPGTFMERGLVVLGENHNAQTEVKLDTSLYFSHANIDWETLKRFAAPVDPKWYAGSPRSAEQVALDTEFDKTFERISARNNEHQLAQEALQREEFGYFVLIPGTLAKRLRESESNDPAQDLELLSDLYHHIIPQLKV